MASYLECLSQEVRMTFIMGDSTLENDTTDIIDFAFVLGARYVNLQGMGKSTRSCKVDRFQEILELV